MPIICSQTIRGIVALAILAGPESLLAQRPNWNAPSAIYLHDAVGKTIRPLVGIVGSSYPGPVVLENIDSAWLALNHKSALVSRAGLLSWIPDLSGPDLESNVSANSLSDLPLPLQVIWAADSARAAMLVAVPARVVWLSHFDGVPGVVASWSLDPGPATWSLLAVDASAKQVLLASKSGDTWQVWLTSPANPPVLIAGINKPGAAVFAKNGTTVYVADAALHQVVEVSALGSSPVLLPVAISDKFVADPVGMALSKDGSRLFLADGAGKMIRVFQTDSGVLISELPLQVAPLSMTALASNSFLLGGRDQKDQPFYLLDTRADGRVFFVPVGQ